MHVILVASTCARVSRQPFVLGEATRDEAGVAVVDEIVRGRGGLVVAGVTAKRRLLVAHVLQGVPCLLSGFRLLVPLTQEGQYTVVPLQRGARPLGSHTWCVPGRPRLRRPRLGSTRWRRCSNGLISMSLRIALPSSNT